MTYHSISSAGGRAVNEDAYLCAARDGRCCFMVADGLGAHGRGEAASQLVIQVFDRLFAAAPRSLSGFIPEAFNAAQASLLAAQRSRHEMKTTGVVLTIGDNRCRWGHIGDSRLYHFRHGVLRNRTLDHSVPQMLAIAGKIKEEEMAGHPDRNRLLRAMGDEWDSPRYVLSKEMRLRKGDAFLLCTDGFWEHLTPADMAALLKTSKTAEEWMTRMRSVVEAHLDPAAADNYTAITVM